MQAQTTHELDNNEGPFLDPVMLLGVINRLTRQLEQARSIAAALEGECARCWGPVHSKAIETIRLGAFYSEGWDDDGA